jgi:hypothetical protein
MKNINSKNSELFEGKTFDYSTHYRMPKIKSTGKRRRKRIAYKGIANQEPESKR